MLEGYKPIDFSSMAGGVDISQLRNKAGLSQAAMGILANSQWNKTPISTLLASGLNEKGEAPPRKQTLWGRAVDLLSLPAYTIANAGDDALAGHQSNDYDSVLDDTGQVIGGLVTGAGRGIGTSLRGAFADSETAADPMDKIYLGDFLIRWDTHMSAEEALKPENREKVRERLMGKKINMFDDSDEGKYFYNFDTGQVEVSDEDIDDYFKEMNLWGIGASIVGDPLNFVKLPAAATKAASAVEVPGKVISGSKNSYEGFKSIPSVASKNTELPRVNLGSMAVGKSPGSYKVNLPPGAIQGRIANPATGELITPPAWFDFPRSPDAMGDVTRTTRTTRVGPKPNPNDPTESMLANWETTSNSINKTSNRGTEKFAAVTPRIPDKQLAIVKDFSNPKRVQKFVNDLLRRAATNESGWVANVRDRIAKKYPGIQFPYTSRFIDRMEEVPEFSRRLAIPAERKKIVAALNATIAEDIKLLATPPKIRPAGEVLNEATQMGPVYLSRLVAKAKGEPGAAVVKPKNAARNSKVAVETFNKFQDQILGKGRPAGIKDPAKYDAAVKSGKTLRYTGPQQAQMWNHITHTLKDVKSPQRFAVANSILRQTEELFIQRGVRAMSSFRASDSVPLRLSQVLEAIGPAAAAMSTTLLTKILRGDPKALSQLPAEVVQRIEDIKAGESLVDASRIAPVVDNVTQDIESLIKGPLSVARTEQIVTIGAKVAEDIASKAGGSPVAGRVAKALTQANVIPKTPVDTAIKSKALNTVALISHPNVSPKLLARYSSAPTVARAIRQEIGGPTPSALGKLLAGTGARIPEWLGARFNAAYKNADMRPIYLREAATAKATVARRAEYLNNLAKRYDVNDADLWNDALKGAQGRMEPLPGTPAAELSKEILEIMENLFGSSSVNSVLRTNVIADSTVVGRAQLFMSELNTNLRRFGLGEYQFSKKGEFSEGVAWLNSWQNWKIEKPLEFLFRVQNVVEHTVREKIMFDEIAARFGTTTRGGEFTNIVNHPRLGGVYFGKEAASQVTQFVKNLKEISQTSSKALQNFDKVVSKWKAGVTIYVPSHHIRNLIGDTYFNWMAGVNSTRPYEVAMKVMRSQKGRYPGLAELDTLTSPEALKKVIATGMAGKPRAIGKQTALTMKNGQQVTNDMVYVSAFQQGILPTTRVLEDIPDDAATMFERFKPLGGRAQKAAHTISEGRDHYIRLAQYIDELKKSPKGFEAAVEDAAAAVRKWHPDGMDLSAFEKNVMRRMFPFYSWTRKAIPLVIESMVATPGKVMAIPKSQYLIQNMLGIQTGPMSDPFPVDQLFPDWLRESGVGPIAGPESGLTDLLGGQPGYTVMNPGNPTMDVIADLNHPGKFASSMINPAVRIPWEIASGTEAQTGAPIDNGPMGVDTDYLIKQVPGLSHAGRITGEFGVSDTTKENSQGYNMQNILNLLTALGFQNTGPYQKSAEFDLRDFLRRSNGS